MLPNVSCKLEFSESMACKFCTRNTKAYRFKKHCAALRRTLLFYGKMDQIFWSCVSFNFRMAFERYACFVSSRAWNASKIVT